MEYIRFFETETEYNDYTNSENYLEPNISYALDTDTVFYNIVKTESGDYKVITLSKKDISSIKDTYIEVNLGLPSYALWADRNVGASSPEDSGTYFAWGDTEGFNYEGIKYVTAEQLCEMFQPIVGANLTPDNLDEFLKDIGVENKDLTITGLGLISKKSFSDDWSDYFDTTDGGETFNKYNINNGIKKLEIQDDAACVNGSYWQTPTATEVEELINNTTQTFIDLDGNEFSKSEAENGAIGEYNLKGIKFTGSNGNSIFIPSSGSCCGTTQFDTGLYGCLWTSTLSSYTSNEAKYVYFDCDGVLDISYMSRYYGHTVRGLRYPPM